MKFSCLLISVLLSFSFSVYAQSICIDDTTVVNRPPIRPLTIINNPTIIFTAVATSDYSITIEKDGDIIDYFELALLKGESYIIDMTIYATGRYNLFIYNLRNNIRYEYIYIKDDENES